MQNWESWECSFKQVSQFELFIHFSLFTSIAIITEKGPQNVIMGMLYVLIDWESEVNNWTGYDHLAPYMFIYNTLNCGE